jgi:Domain of unknown function (DUF4168)
MGNIFSFFFRPSRKRCLTTSPNTQQLVTNALTGTIREYLSETQSPGLENPARSSKHPKPILKLLSSALSHHYTYTIPQSLLFGVITTASVISSTLLLNSKAYAQTSPVNNTEINSYAQAVLAMEPARQHAFEEIKKLIGSGEIPKIVCNDGNSINGLPRKAQDIAVNYCTRSQKIVEDNGLSIDRFNKITIEAQNDNNLKRQIYNTLLRLQKTSDLR